MKHERTRWARTIGVFFLLLFAAGCSTPVDPLFRDNMPPEVRLTAAPVNSQDRYFYAYRMNWLGFDPDGRVDHFLIAVDPARPDSVDDTWQVTNKNEEIIFFRASTPDTVQVGISEDFHVFAIAAVDEKGAKSKPVYRAFFSYTEAPRVTIEAPVPNASFVPIVTPTVRIRWRGVDPDGQFTTRPVKYKFQIFGKHNPDFPAIPDFVTHVLTNPKFLNWMYAPTFGPSEKCPTCSVWESTSAETTEKQYISLVPNQQYLFAVTGFDEAGAYDPVFSPNSNLLRFAVTYAGTLGPQICMANEFFNYCYVTGGYANDPTRYFNLEVPAGQPVTFNWIAFPPQGADMRRYRWVLDLQDLTDETPRTNELTDWYHWSAYGAQLFSATIGPFNNAPEDHLFFIEAEDNNGLRSLGIIHFTVVRATFEKKILFVDDSRLGPDWRAADGGVSPPRGTWPSAAELDTFFFAQGGKPWIGYPGSPRGTPAPEPTLSGPGIFRAWGPFGTTNPTIPNPYSSDTLGTRGLLSGLVPLAVLGRYELVVWYTDDVGSTYTNSPFDLLSPTTSLRLMSIPGQPSTISTYLKQGGKLWMMGGGAAYATLRFWNRVPPPDEFTNADLELISGRFMYDFAKWQSAVAIRPAQQAVINTPLWAPWPNAALGRGWTNQGMTRTLNQPNYTKLSSDPIMEVLSPRSAATDPLPPLRAAGSFYSRFYTAEFIGRVDGSRADNQILEDSDLHPDVFTEVSTLDTLYIGLGGSVGTPSPIMTYYHGFQSPQVVFMGAPLWFFQRPQIQKIADFVIEDIFNYPKTQAPEPAAPGIAALKYRPQVSSSSAAMPSGARKVSAPLRR
jgi:hypothetical protein